VRLFGLQRLNGDKMNLIKIKHEGSKDGWALVNEADFDSKKHERFEGEPKRARNNKGQLIADDPSTPDVNEAYESGKAPKKAAKKKASTKKG